MSDDFTRISPAEAWEKMESGVPYIDVRRPDEFAGGRPRGAVNVPIDDSLVSAIAAKFDKSEPLIVGCEAGGRSRRAAAALAAAGFTRVFDQRAGWSGARDAFGQVIEAGWKKSGLPIDE